MHRLALIACFSAPVLAAAAQAVVATKTTLPADSPLELSFSGDIARCADALCLVTVAVEWKDVTKSNTALAHGDGVLLRVQADGTWVALGAEEKKDDEAGKGTEGESATAEPAAAESAADPAATGATAESTGPKAIELSEDMEKKCKKKAWKSRAECSTVPLDWRDAPVIPYADRRAKRWKETLDKMPVELARGTLLARDGRNVLVLPKEQVPAGDFFVFTNGDFGLEVDGKPVGSPTMFGAARFER
jgi:hypothetical protein